MISQFIVVVVVIVVIIVVIVDVGHVNVLLLSSPSQRLSTEGAEGVMASGLEDVLLLLTLLTSSLLSASLGEGSEG